MDRVDIIGTIIIVNLLIFVFLIIGVLLGNQSKCQEEDVELTLPQICAPYYNDGTDRWKECMQVGYK